MAPHPSTAGASSGSLPKPLVIALSAIAGVGVLALVVLIVRELAPHHAELHASAPKVEETSAPLPEPPVVAPTPAPTVARAPVTAATAPVATHAAAPPPPDGFVGVRALASIIHNPESVPTEGVFHNRVGGLDQYAYDSSFGPFRRGELKRDAKNPDAWEVDGSNGPGHTNKIEDIAPPGATREAATIRDDKGNAVGTWYTVEAGPLAPAYATVMPSGGTRIISRAYLETNRGEFPSDLTSLLDR